MRVRNEKHDAGDRTAGYTREIARHEAATRNARHATEVFGPVAVGLGITLLALALASAG